MKILLTLSLVIVAISLLAMTPAAYSQEKAGAEATFTGQLTKVDMNAKSISVQGPDNKDMLFTYTDQTQVVSPDKNIQGLAGKTGTTLKITYHVDKGANMATRIETVQK